MLADVTTRYRTLNRLGEGAMGEVWQVEDSLHPTAPLALKCIKLQGGDAAELTLRFQAEFYAMARLKHPNMVGVHDYGVGRDGNVYLVMDLVPGQDLSAPLATGPVSLETFYSLFAQLLQALEYLHARQLVHRDIKAANVRIRSDGVLVLMDFGLATRSGSAGEAGISGTPGYMAPELLLGRAATGLTDLYAAGCLAYEMLSGGLPFQGAVGQVLRAQLRDRPPSLAAARPDLPASLVGLVNRLLEKDPAARPRSAAHVLHELAALAGLAITQESLAQRQSFLHAADLVGRTAELDALGAALSEAAAGRSCGMLIGAPAGTGKSRLLQEVTLRAQLAGFLVLHGHCREEGAAPYEAVREGLRAGLAAAPALGDRHPQTLEALYPERRSGPASGDQAVSLDGVLALLSDLAAQRPVLWILDDLHWADPQTVAVFNAAIRGLGERPIVCLGTFRDDETPPGHPLWQTVEEGVSTLLRLRPLSREDQDELLAALLPEASIPAGFSEALFLAAGGNPLFIQEALRMLLDESLLRREAGRWRFPEDPGVLAGLQRVELTIQRRLAHLAPETLRVIQVTSVLGAGGSLQLLAACADLPDGDLFAALADLLERQLLVRNDAGDVVFPHDRVREVVYAGIESERRRSLHLRAGEFLAARGDDGRDVNQADLARHFLRGGDDERGYAAALRAAEQAVAAGADYVALEHWEAADEALARLPGDRLAERFPIWLWMGRDGFHLAARRATQALARALAAWETEPARVEALLVENGLDLPELLVLFGRALGIVGEIQAALGLAERLDVLLQDEQGLRKILVANCRYMPLLVAGRIDELMEWVSRAVREIESHAAEELPVPIQRFLIGTYGNLNARAWQGHRPDTAVLHKALAYAAAVGDPDPFLPRVPFGLWSLWAGHFDETEAYIERTVRRTRAIGAPPSPFVLYLAPALQFYRGEYAEALAALERSLGAHAHLRHQALPFYLCQVLKGRLLDALGRESEALAVFEQVLETSRAKGLGLSLIQGLIGQASVWRDMGQTTQARESYREALALASEGVWRNPLLQAHAAMGLGLCDLPHQPGQALARLDDALATVARPEFDHLLMPAHIQRARGRALDALGRAGEAQQARQAARRLFQRMGLPYWIYQVEQDGSAAAVAPKPAVVPSTEALKARFERFGRLM